KRGVDSRYSKTGRRQPVLQNGAPPAGRTRPKGSPSETVVLRWKHRRCKRTLVMPAVASETNGCKLFDRGNGAGTEPRPYRVDAARGHLINVTILMAM